MCVCAVCVRVCVDAQYIYHMFAWGCGCVWRQDICRCTCGDRRAGVQTVRAADSSSAAGVCMHIVTCMQPHIAIDTHTLHTHITKDTHTHTHTYTHTYTHTHTARASSVRLRHQLRFVSSLDSVFMPAFAR